MKAASAVQPGADNRPACTAELAEVARAMGVGGGERDESRLAGLAIETVVDLFAAIRIPSTPAELGLPADKRDWTAEQAIGIGRLIKNNPRSLDLASMTVLVGAAYDGDRQRLAGADRITEGV